MPTVVSASESTSGGCRRRRATMESPEELFGMPPKVAMQGILNSHVEEAAESGRFHFGQEMGDFLLALVEDLSIFDTPSHDGDQARLPEEVVPCGLSPLEKRDGTAVEPLGKELKDAIGALWRA